jgi:hypothetical protein
MSDNFKFNIFVSYAWLDQTAVHQLCESLEKEKITLWIDKNLMKHGNIDTIMRKGIDESQFFLCCATTSYCLRENTLKEFNYAIAKGKKIIYVLFEKFKDEKETLEKLKEISFNFARQLYFKHDKIEKIVEAFKELNKVTIYLFILSSNSLFSSSVIGIEFWDLCFLYYFILIFNYLSYKILF